MELYRNILYSEIDTTQNYSFDKIIKILKRPVILPKFRISVLNPNETIDYIIPSEDIPVGGISFSENYQQGQRKSLTLNLINYNGKYTPKVGGIWIDTRFRLDIGMEVSGNIIWFPKGVYVMGNISVVRNNSDKTVSYNLKDKFALFEDKTGTLSEAYEVPVDSTIEDAIQGILNFDRGNGYIYDYKDIILDSSFAGFKTQVSIRKEAGDNLGSVILELATQMSAECYYNNVGNLCFIPIDETVNDENKPVIWTYKKFDRDLHSLNLTYNNDNIINAVKVIGNNVDYGIFSAEVKNENSISPICVGRVGLRYAPPYSEENVWSDDTAYSLARYYLRKNSFVSVQFSCPVSFNPVLNVNNLCEVEDDFLGLKRDKLLITSLSFTSESGLMNVSFVNTSDLPMF